MEHTQKDFDELYRAFLLLENKEECKMLFDDLFTMSELNAISQRLKVAGLLKQKHTCQNIAAETGASTATISRINRCLQYGAGGYELILNRLDEQK